MVVMVVVIKSAGGVATRGAYSEQLQFLRGAVDLTVVAGDGDAGDTGDFDGMMMVGEHGDDGDARVGKQMEHRRDFHFLGWWCLYCRFGALVWSHPE